MVLRCASTLLAVLLLSGCTIKRAVFYPSFKEEQAALQEAVLAGAISEEEAEKAAVWLKKARKERLVIRGEFGALR